MGFCGPGDDLSTNCEIDGGPGNCSTASGLASIGAAAECPTESCGMWGTDPYTGQQAYLYFTAGAGGATGYLSGTDWSLGVNEWNDAFKSDTQFDAIVKQLEIQQQWALATAIAAKNGQDVADVFAGLTPVKTVGGNTDFQADANIDLSFLNSDQDNRSGDVHQHTSDGLVHLDTFNPYSSFPVGAIGHFVFDLVLGNINSSVPR